MIIQVTGTGTSNKGAELLLIAVQQQVMHRFPDARIAVQASFGTWEDRARYGLRTVLPEVPKGRWWLAGRLMPPAFRESCGVVAEKEVSLVLDASGFAFGDQLGLARVQEFAASVKRWKSQGKPVILLPQAFGPFENNEIRQCFEDVVANVDLIYAREPRSFDYVQQIRGAKKKLSMAPDFTALVEPCSVQPSQYDAFVVPNYQMIAKSSPDQAAKYVPFLAECINQLRQLGLSAAVLLHDDRIDSKIVDPLAEVVGELPVICESDPRKLKGLLGSVSLVIGSRFHALVSALSQGVPTVAAGWSHKYEMLLNEYSCVDAMLSVDFDAQQIRDVICKVRENDVARRAGLSKASANVKRASLEMWGQIYERIGNQP